MSTKPIDERKSQIVIHLIHVALHNTSTLDHSLLYSTPIEWDDVLRYAAAQGVMAIVWDGLMELQHQGVIDSNIGPTREQRLRWAYNVEQIEKRYRKQVAALTHLSRILATHNIRVAPLKGYGLSLCYPIPEHRACSDIDIWLFGEQQRADEILRNEYNITIDEDEHHHTVFYINGVMVENHYDFLNIHAHHSSRDIEEHLKRLSTEGSEAITIDGATIYLPSANCHALFLLRHAASHFAAAEIVLRHVIDWGLFVKRYHSEIDWSWLRRVCKEQKMEQFFDAMNVISSDICNIDLSLMPDTTRRAALEQRILNDILRPEFSEKRPEKGLIRIICFKLRRWWANRWKHRLVYRDGLIHSFITQSWSHILKPKGIRS